MNLFRSRVETPKQDLEKNFTASRLNHFTMALCAWYNSANASNFAMLVLSESHYQLGSLRKNPVSFYGVPEGYIFEGEKGLIN
jgi:hypothetical protein